MKSFKVDVDESNTQEGARLEHSAPLEHQGKQITNRDALKTLLPGEAKWTLELGTSGGTNRDSPNHLQCLSKH